MRDAFIKTLTELARQNDRIWLLCGDLGYSVLEKFRDQFPDRFINAGVAEQNMTGTAAGLALSGKIVFTYSIGNFNTLRCLEQIRNDIAYHNANVKIVSVGGGYSYGSQGYTHHAVEDYGIMSLLPNMTVVAPADPIETELATRALVSLDGPCYMRLGKAGEPIIHATPPEFSPGRALLLPSEQRDAVSERGKRTASTVIATGAALQVAAAAAQELRVRGHEPQLISMPFLNPFDQQAVLNAAAASDVIVTVEEHGPGGMASKVAEVLALSGARCKLRIIRLKPECMQIAGSQNYLREKQGLTAAAVVAAVLESIDRSVP